MAEKIQREDLPKPPALEGQDDLAVLHPERVVFVNGRQLIAREYGFVEGLQLTSKIEPLLNDLSELLKSPNIPLLRIQGVLGVHADLTVELIAQATDVDVAFVRGLNNTDGTKLMSAWWAANSAFFLKRAVEAIITERIAANHRAGPTYTKHSSATATAQPASDAIHAGK